MKKYFLYTSLLFFLSSCFNVKKEECYSIKPDDNYIFLNFIKRQYNFNYLKFITDVKEYGTNNNFYDYSWIRKDENLKKYYASIKTLGLKKIISDEQFNKPLFTDYKESFWENRSLKEIIKGLINSYDKKKKSQ